MDLHHLRYVVKLAKRLHFSQAAAELNITQPSLSQCIMQIEQELGVKLFERKTRSVSLTVAGEEFVIYAEKVLVAWEQLHEGMRSQSATKKGTLRVGTLLNMSRLDLNNKVWDFQKENPLIQVTIGEIVGSFELIRHLETEVFDVVFFVPSLEVKLSEWVEVCPVMPGRVVAVVAEEHRLADNETITMKELADENLLFPSRLHSMFGVLLAECRNNGFEPKVISQCSQIETSMKIAAKGMGVALLSSQFACASDCKGVRIIPLDPLIPRTISMAYSTRATAFSAVKAFRDFILQSVGD